MSENWQGVDIGVTARLRNGLTLQGGTSTGRKVTDTCALRALVPEQNFSGGGVTNPYCHVVEEYATAATGLATYPIPKVDVQVSVTWQSKPGTDARGKLCGDQRGHRRRDRNRSAGRCREAPPTSR